MTKEKLSPENAIRIIQSYQTPYQIRRSCGRDYGLDYTEALEMAYDNIIHTARMVKFPKLKQSIKNL